MAVKKKKKASVKNRIYHKIFVSGLIALLICGVVWFERRMGSRREINEVVGRYALKHKIPAALIEAVIEQESSYDPMASGKAGEIGLMQLMPPGKPGAAEEWARIHKVKCPSRWKLYNIETNINIGSWYLARSIRKWSKYRCAVELALIEYNGGHKYSSLYKPETFDGDVVSRIDSPGIKKYVVNIMKNYRSSQR